MKKLLVLLVSVLICANSCWVFSQEWGRSPYLTQSFPASSINHIDIATLGGNIILTADADSIVKVEMYVSHSYWSATKIKQVLDENYTVDIKALGRKLYIMTEHKKMISSKNQQDLSISFKIFAPKKLNSNLQTMGGSIQISNIFGSHNLNTSGGALMVENVSGSITGLSAGGNITVLKSDNNINLKTSVGSITAKECKGRIVLKSSGGSINMNNLTGNIDASTVAGSLTANEINGIITTVSSGGSVKLNGISGDVEATASGGILDVKLKSVNEYVRLLNSENINLTLPAEKGYFVNVKANNVSTSGIKDFNGTIDNKIIEGKIGAGGTRINVRSSQRVRLTFE